MCLECGNEPCLLRCPNYKRRKAFLRCAGCSGGIYNGEEYIIVGGKYYHKECANELSVMEILKGFGIGPEVCDIWDGE